MITTPTTEAGLKQFDHRPPHRAIEAAWHEFGPQPEWHARARVFVTWLAHDMARALTNGSARQAVTEWCRLPASVQDQIRSAMPVLARALERAETPG